MPRIDHELDGRPGALPTISVVADGVVYVMAPFGVRELSLRCDDDGGLWIAIKERDLDHPRSEA